MLSAADTSTHLPQARPAQHPRPRLQGTGNINTHLELAIRIQTGRFSLAIDSIDRMSRVTGAAAREVLLNRQIACQQYAYQFGISTGRGGLEVAILDRVRSRRAYVETENFYMKKQVYEETGS
jgi:hypothetical protein